MMTIMSMMIMTMMMMMMMMLLRCPELILALVTGLVSRLPDKVWLTGLHHHCSLQVTTNNTKSSLNHSISGPAPLQCCRGLHAPHCSAIFCRHHPQPAGGDLVTTRRSRGRRGRRRRRCPGLTLGGDSAGLHDHDNEMMMMMLMDDGDGDAMMS